MVCLHVTKPYNKTDFTLELKMVSLVLMRMFMLFQTGSRVTHTCLAFSILDLMFSSCLVDNASYVSEALDILFVLFCHL